ncbi:MAG: metallophosphoesterase [Clostridia bacterium]|nr:metallophosphoesterase [Clostridia bacterium]MBR5976560.1 metallophosphoesterase [Clostridia bacterium]MBR6479103.1 metallophosphoesterase [Clostridia bacterium]
MSLFAIGDTHLSTGADKPMDIFGGWQDHMERLEKNWRAVVGPDDTVVIPGDISWAMRLSEAKSDFEFLESLPGKKIIGKGNHDYWWQTMRKLETFLEENNFKTISFLFNNAYAAEGVAVCGSRGWFFDDDSPESELVIQRECGRIRTSIAAAKETGLPPIVFLHYPPITRDRMCEPIMEVLVESGIDRCCYAHLHGAAIDYAFREEYEGIKFDLVSADSLGFVPKLLVQ